MAATNCAASVHIASRQLNAARCCLNFQKMLSPFRASLPLAAAQTIMDRQVLRGGLSRQEWLKLLVDGSLQGFRDFNGGWHVYEDSFKGWVRREFDRNTPSQPRGWLNLFGHDPRFIRVNPWLKISSRSQPRSPCGKTLPRHLPLHTEPHSARSNSREDNEARFIPGNSGAVYEGRSPASSRRLDTRALWKPRRQTADGRRSAVNSRRTFRLTKKPGCDGASALAELRLQEIRFVQTTKSEGQPISPWLTFTLFLEFV